MSDPPDESLVFGALRDESRRILLDALAERDGQTQTELASLLDMTRFGVMKHLAALEDANLIIVERSGRQKFHYLNPIPIQEIYDRWVSKFARPITAQLSGLKHRLEGPMATKPTTDHSSTTHRYRIYIRAPRDDVWQALTSSEHTPAYYFGTTVASTWRAGEPYSYTFPDGNVALGGNIVEIDPPGRLVHTFVPGWNEDNELGESLVTWDLSEDDGVTCVNVVHEQLPAIPEAERIIDGWSRILSGLKTYLETGEAWN